MGTGRISRERLEAPPGAVYTETILEPGYNFMLEHYFYPLVETNKAWTVMLCETGIIGEDSAGALLNAILTLEAEGPEALGEFDPRYEYFYSHMEHYLIDKVGEEIAGREAETVMPQWTHFQHAQLSTVGHYFVGIVDSLGRDFDRLSAAYSTVNQCTLGCGALAGSSYPLDRQLVAELLGFNGFRENTVDCVSSSDFMLETSAALANMMITLSRLCQDLYIWHTEEFDFVVISDEYAGSSSMMPQKKNSYPFEYVRARAARAVGDMASAFGTLHNTNFQDIKDVEEEVVYPVFRSFDEASLSLRLLKGTISSMEFKRDSMLKKAAEGYGSCTELAAKIHRQTDLSYRTAHRIVGNLVLRAFKQGKAATEVDALLVNESAKEIIGREVDVDDETVRASLDPTVFVRAHDVPGGPAPEAVHHAIRGAHTTLAGHDQRVVQWREALNRAGSKLSDQVNQRVDMI